MKNKRMFALEHLHYFFQMIGIAQNMIRFCLKLSVIKVLKD